MCFSSLLELAPSLRSVFSATVYLALSTLLLRAHCFDGSCIGYTSLTLDLIDELLRAAAVPRGGCAIGVVARGVMPLLCMCVLQVLVLGQQPTIR